MTARLRLVAVALVCTALTNTSASEQSAMQLFQQGLMLERAEGKSQEAAFLYERVIAEFPHDRAVIPQALYQLAIAYEKRGDPRATLLLTRLVTEYATAAPYAVDAQRKLEAMQSRASAGPFKPRALDSAFELGSPDGKFVVYRKNQDRSVTSASTRATTPLYLRNLTTRTDRELSNVAGCSAWSPDSTQIVCVGQDGTRIVNVATGESQPMQVRGNVMAMTAKGELLAFRFNFEKNTVDINLVPIGGGEASTLLTLGVNEGNWSTITPDGRALVLVKSDRLVLFDIASRTERPITGGSAREERPVVSPDSRLVAFASNRDGRTAVYVAPLDRIPVREPVRIGYIDGAGLAGARRAFDWATKDGLVTYSLSFTESNVFRVNMDPETGRALDAAQRLTQDTIRNIHPAISPDSKHIAYNYYDANGAMGIAVMDATGLSERPLVPQPGNMPLAWRSADEILFHDFARPAGERGGIASLNIKSGARQAVTDVGGLYWEYAPARREIFYLARSGTEGSVDPSPGSSLRAYSLANGTDRAVGTIPHFARMAVSPNGERIAYASYPDGKVGNRCEVALMTADGTPERVLVPAQQPCAAPAAWSPNGRYLLLTGGSGSATGSPRIVDVQSLQSWPLHESMANQQGWFGGSWAPDGSFVVLSQTSQRMERAAWEGVTYDAVIKLLKRN